MVFTCPECGQGMEAPNSAVGKKLLCPSCQFTFVATLPKATVLGEDDSGGVTDVYPANGGFVEAEILGPAEPSYGPVGGDPFPPINAPPSGPPPGYVAPPQRQQAGPRRGGFGGGGRRSRRRATADALARLATGEHVGEQEPSHHPPMPPGWYLEEPDGLKGPYTSLDISKAMQTGSMPSDAMLWHSTKQIRVKVREVRELVQKIRDEKRRAKAAASARAEQAVRAAQAEKTKKAKKAGKTARPVAKPEPQPQEAPPNQDEQPAQGEPADALSLLAQAARTSSRPEPKGRAASRVAPQLAPSQSRGASAMLWIVRATLLGCGATTALPWLSTRAVVGAASQPVERVMNLFQLSMPMAIVILLCFAAAVGVSFLVARHRVAQIGFVSQVAVTCLVILVPFIFYGDVGRGADGGAKTRVTMGWGAWLGLGMNVLAMLLAVVYLFVRAKGSPAGGYTAELVEEDLDEEPADDEEPA